MYWSDVLQPGVNTVCCLYRCWAKTRSCLRSRCKSQGHNLLSQAHMWPQGWNNTAAFLSEQTTHSSICESKTTKENKSIYSLCVWVRATRQEPLIPWFSTGPGPCRLDTFWHGESRENRWQCVHRVRTECPSSCLNTPYTPPVTRCCCSEMGCGCPPGRCNIHNKKHNVWERAYYKKEMLTKNKAEETPSP